MAHQSFTPSEFNDLLGRAAHLQAAADAKDRSEHTLSLDELKEAAKSAGIDPSFVEQALHSPPVDTPIHPDFLGMATGVRRSTLIPGPVSEDAWGEMVLEFRRSLGGKGTTETIGQIRDWSKSPLRITIEPEGDAMRVIANADWSGEPKVLTGMMVLMGVFSVAFLALSFVTSETAFAWFGGLYALIAVAFSGLLWPRLNRKKARLGPRFESVLSRVEDIAERHNQTDSKAQQHEDMLPPKPSIDLPEAEKPATLSQSAHASDRSREQASRRSD